jgi:hypothetical protein
VEQVLTSLEIQAEGPAEPELKTRTVDVIISSAGRPTLQGVVDAWNRLNGELKDDFQLNVVVVCDGEFARPEGAELICFSEQTGQHGNLVDVGIKATSGEFVVVGFDDDPPPDLKNLLEVLVSSGALWASGAVAEQDPAGQPTGVVYKGAPQDHLLYRNTVPLQGCIFRRGVFEKVPFVEKGCLSWTVDHDFVLRLWLSGLKHAQVHGEVGRWTVNPEGITSAVRSAEDAEAWQNRRADIWKTRRELRFA